MTSPTIIIPSMKKGMNAGAFRGELTCPHLVGDGNTLRECKAKNWKFVEKISSFRIRYRCGTCGKTIQYDFSSNLAHPYSVFGKSKWTRIVDAWKRKKGMHPLAKA